MRRLNIVCLVHAESNGTILTRQGINQASRCREKLEKISLEFAISSLERRTCVTALTISNPEKTVSVREKSLWPNGDQEMGSSSDEVISLTDLAKQYENLSLNRIFSDQMNGLALQAYGLDAWYKLYRLIYRRGIPDSAAVLVVGHPVLLPSMLYMAVLTMGNKSQARLILNGNPHGCEGYEVIFEQQSENEVRMTVKNVKRFNL